MSFADQLKNARVAMIAETDQHRKFITLELFNSVIRDTPVDTGRARGNWQTSAGTPIQTDIDRLDKTQTGQNGGAAMEDAEMVVLNSQPDSTVYLTNNLPYIEKLEFGSSKQSPAGMVRKNMARINQIIKETKPT